MLSLAIEHMTDAELHALLDGINNLLEERDRRYDANRKHDREYVDRAFAAAEKAADRALVVTNEFRGQLSDQNLNFVRKEEYSSRWEDVERRLDLLSSQIGDASVRIQGAGFFGGIFMQLASLVIAAIALFLTLHKG